MPIQELCHFTVRRFFGTGKTPSGGFTRADGRVRDRDQPEARARIHERVHADALAWFSNLVAIANPPNGTWFQPSPARYSRIAAHRENIIAESTKKGHPSRARPGSAAQFGDPRGWVRTRRRDGRGTHRAQLLPVGGDQPAQAALGRRQGAFPDLAPSESFPEPWRPDATHDARPSSLADVRHGRGGDPAL